MSRRNVLAQEKPHLACELCCEEIVHDVVRVDGGRIYHMRCFNQRVNAGKRELRECPTCQTLALSGTGAILSGTNATCARGPDT